MTWSSVRRYITAEERQLHQADKYRCELEVVINLPNGDANTRRLHHLAGKQLMVQFLECENLWKLEGGRRHKC